MHSTYGRIAAYGQTYTLILERYFDRFAVTK